MASFFLSMSHIFLNLGSVLRQLEAFAIMQLNRPGPCEKSSQFPRNLSPGPDITLTPKNYSCHAATKSSRLEVHLRKTSAVLDHDSVHSG